MTVLAPLTRQFTPEQSSAIAAIMVDGPCVQVCYQSNPERVYSFTASTDFAGRLASVLMHPLDCSIGRMIATARQQGDLTEGEPVW